MPLLTGSPTQKAPKRTFSVVLQKAGGAAAIVEGSSGVQLTHQLRGAVKVEECSPPMQTVGVLGGQTAQQISKDRFQFLVPGLGISSLGLRGSRKSSVGLRA